MTWIIDGFAAFGLMALITITYAAGAAWIQLRSARAQAAAAIRDARADLAHGAPAGASDPSAYTIPKGPSS